MRHVPPGEAKSLWVFGGLVTFYALGEDTGGAVTLCEEATAPRAGALPHLHHEEDQAFYVLEGEHEFVCGGETFEAKPGSFVYVPRGTVHSFENVGEAPGRLLILSTPAGGTERFFFEVGEPARDGASLPPSNMPEGMEGIAKIREIARRHGSDIDTLALLRQLTASSASNSKGGDRYEQP